MSYVQLIDSTRYQLAQALLENAASVWKTRLHPKELAVEIADPRVVRLFSRLNGNQPVILPYPTSSGDHWLITGPHRHLLDQARTRVSRFLNPSYGYFPGGVPKMQAFDPSASQVQEAAAQLYPEGYYRWQSPRRHREAVLDRLMLWLDLEAERPELVQAPVINYRTLYQSFQEALESSNWTDAAQILEEIRDHHLTTAENLIFLRLQLLARQEKWQAIWEDPDFSLWADLPMPRTVRALLLTAFHTQILLPLEEQGQWTAALEAFGEKRPRLQSLLTGPFDLDDPGTVRVLAYQAVADQHQARLELLANLELEALTQQMLDTLLEEVDVQVNDEEARSPYEQALEALHARDFATAERAIEEVTDPATRTLLLLELAFHTEDSTIREKAWKSYQELSFEDQEALQEHQRFVRRYLEDLKDFALPTEERSKEHLVPREAGAPEADSLRKVAWDQICRVESALRLLITRRYEAKFGEQWLSRISSKKLEKWKDMQSKDQSTFALYDQTQAPLLDYSYLGDLLVLINREWNLFREDFLPFGQNSKEAKRRLQLKVEAINRARNPLAHNRTVPRNELKRADVYATDILMVLDKEEDQT